MTTPRQLDDSVTVERDVVLNSLGTRVRVTPPTGSLNERADGSAESLGPRSQAPPSAMQHPFLNDSPNKKPTREPPAGALASFSSSIACLEFYDTPIRGRKRGPDRVSIIKRLCNSYCVLP